MEIVIFHSRRHRKLWRNLWRNLWGVEKAFIKRPKHKIQPFVKLVSSARARRMQRQKFIAPAARVAAVRIADIGGNL